MVKRYSLFAGPALFGLFWLADPLSIGSSGASVLGVLAWMLTWWIAECVPMAVTSLLPIVLFPLLGILSIDKVCLNYGNRFVFLFLGGFMIALAMEKWNLHKRLALGVVNKTGTHANRIIFGFLLASFLISMWISNTATTLMMLPIAASVVGLLVNEDQRNSHKGTRHFATALMLSIAYGASIGGIGTLVGSPPNASMAGVLQSQFGQTVSFFDWMKWGFPFAIALLLGAYLLLVYVIFPNRLGKLALGHEIIRLELAKLGPWTRPQRGVFILFLSTATLWICQDFLSRWLLPLGVEITDVGISILAASLLFLIPSGNRDGTVLLSWKDTEKLPWGVLLMFGGGLALADGFKASGLLEAVTSSMSGLDKSHTFLFVSLLCLIGLGLTALLSNLAMVSIFVPVVAQLALDSGHDPALFAIPVTIAASCDFMFPMSTPPNAIAYSSGYIRAGDMLRAGILLNILSFLLLMAMVWLSLR